MAKTVNKTSKKEDIWDAYNELVAKLEEKANEEPKKKQENMQQNEIIKSTTDMNAEKIIKNIAALKSNLSASLDSLEETMLQEFKKLEFIKKSIEIEEAKIKNTFDIQTNAHSLIALVTLQKEQKESFEIEMNELRMNFESEMNSKREQWKHENEDTEKANKDKKSENDKQRKREEEEYQYNLTLNRKKENDAFIEKQELLETAGSQFIREDLRRLTAGRHNLMFYKGKVDLDRYIEFLNGDISISSGIGKGITYTFAVVGEILTSIEGQLASLPKPIGKKNKVLVVEDDYATSKLLSNYLSKWGYEPTIVNSAQQALKIVESQQFLSVIMDIILPDANDAYDECIVLLITP